MRDGELVAENSTTTRGPHLRAEILARYEPDEWFFGWIAVTVLRPNAGSPAVTDSSEFDQIQPHAARPVDLGAGWNVG